MKYLKPFEKFTGLNQVRIKIFEQFELDSSEPDEIFVTDLKEKDLEIEDSEKIENEGIMDSSESDS